MARPPMGEEARGSHAAAAAATRRQHAHGESGGASGSKTAASVYAEQLNMRASVGHQYDPMAKMQASSCNGGAMAPKLPPGMEQGPLWRVPGSDVGTGGQASTFWESRKAGRVDQPLYATRSALLESRQWKGPLTLSSGNMHANIGGGIQGEGPGHKDYIEDYQVGSLNKGINGRGRERVRGGQNYGTNAQTGMGFDGSGKAKGAIM